VTGITGKPEIDVCPGHESPNAQISPLVCPFGRLEVTTTSTFVDPRFVELNGME
jgi:hypothetical protein